MDGTSLRCAELVFPIKGKILKKQKLDIAEQNLIFRSWSFYVEIESNISAKGLQEMASVRAFRGMGQPKVQVRKEFFHISVTSCNSD